MLRCIPLAACLLLVSTLTAVAQETYTGFDKNGYPGDAQLPALHRSFAYTGYWLNNPPGMTSNPWEGKRGIVHAAGFGFLLLFNARLDAQLKGHDAAALGHADGAAAIAAAQHEHFPSGAVIFLDQEEGGRLLPEQAAYLGAWLSTVSHTVVSGSRYGAGVYCSGISVPSGTEMMSTAQDVMTRFPNARLWVWNDKCPPAPGCVVPGRSLDPARSGFPQALVWQYAQSPRRPEDTAACRQTYAANGLCYAPHLPQTDQTFIDLDVSGSPDPSYGR